MPAIMMSSVISWSYPLLRLRLISRRSSDPGDTTLYLTEALLLPFRVVDGVSFPVGYRLARVRTCASL